MGVLAALAARLPRRPAWVRRYVTPTALSAALGARLVGWDLDKNVALESDGGKDLHGLVAVAVAAVAADIIRAGRVVRYGCGSRLSDRHTVTLVLKGTDRQGSDDAAGRALLWEVI